MRDSSSDGLCFICNIDVMGKGHEGKRWGSRTVGGWKRIKEMKNDHLESR